MIPITLTFLDQMIGNQVVPSLLISVYDAAGTTLVTYGRTNSSGRLPLTIAAGNYILRTFKLGVTPSEEDLEVEIGSGDFTFYVSTILIAPPPSPRVCRLFGDFVSLDGTPYEKFKLQIQSLFDPMAAGGLGVVEKTFNVETDASGHVEFDVVRGARIRVTFITTPMSREIVVPDKNIENLLTAMGSATDTFAVVRR